MSSELFNNLKTFILGTKTAEIDKEIDSSLQSIELFSSKNSHNKYVETIKNIVSKTTVSDPNNILKSIQGTPQPQYYDQTGRINRYNEYDSIISKISYCQRAIITITDHILSPDDITKRTILFLADENTQVEKDTLTNIIGRLKSINKKVNFENKVEKVVKSTLKKGDYFVEILYSPKGQNALTILKEQTGQEPVKINVDASDILTIGTPIQETTKIQVKNGSETKEEDFSVKIILETTALGGVYSGMTPAVQGFGSISGSASGGAFAPTYVPGPINEPMSKDKHITKTIDDVTGKKDKKEDDPDFKSKYDKNGETGEVKVDLKDLFITLHNPKYVIRLETERFRSCLGFLVFPKIDPALASGGNYGNFSANIIDGICNQIISRVHDSLKGNDKIKLSADLKDAVIGYLRTMKTNEDLKIRYVPPEMMIHWRTNVDRYDPYGESILECVNFDCRLLIALKTATTIKRLTGCTDKRTVYVETGLPRDAKNIVETLKEGLSKRKISIDKMGSIDTIPTQISTFETTYIPMRDGKRFVEIEKQEWGQSASEDIEPLKFIRDGIVANLGVPAPYLGLEENTSNRSLLTTESINFCRTIIAFQKELSVYLKEMYEKIYRLVYGDNDIPLFDNIRITFQEPKISPYEHEMEYVEQMQRLIEALKQLGVPVEWMKKKYLPNIDWEQIKKYNAEEAIDKELGDSPPAADQMGAGGTPGLY